MLSAFWYFHDKKSEARIFPLAFVERYFTPMQLSKCLKLLKCHFKSIPKKQLE